ncbi:hypothetical protein OSTOST_15098, partial [Ostertagia ostertagi]
ADVSTAVGQPTPQTTECVTAKEEGPPGVTTARTTSEKTTEIVTKRTTEKILTGEECTSANQPTPKVQSEDSRTATQPTPKAVRFVGLETSSFYYMSHFLDALLGLMRAAGLHLSPLQERMTAARLLVCSHRKRMTVVGLRSELRLQIEAGGAMEI